MKLMVAGVPVIVLAKHNIYDRCYKKCLLYFLTIFNFYLIMKKDNKLTLEDLKVNSFTTSEESHILGGGELVNEISDETDGRWCTCDCACEA
ncbi:MAG: pinensin family lanthipeptide [Cyclobacteriaceae bacterium]